MQVRKRTGQIEDFDISKVAKAIYKARLDADHPKTLEESFIEAKKVLNHLSNEIVDIEQIQDAIEASFIKNDEIEVFKAFTFYREMRRQDRINPWANNDERQDLILEKYLIKGESKKDFLERISLNNYKLLKIFRNREGIWGGRNLYAVGREGNISGSNCFVKGTKVLTELGYKPIEEIKINERVLTSDGTYQIVNEVMENYHSESLLKINSKYFNTPIICTPEHPFLTQDGWVEAKELSVKKRSPKKSPHFIKFKKINLNGHEEIKLDLLEELNNIISDEFILEEDGKSKLQPKVRQLNHGNLIFTKSTINSVNRFIVLDDDLAYVLGRYAGDGSITKRKNTRHNLYSVFQIVGNEDEKDSLNKCADIIETKFGLKVNRQYTQGAQKTYVLRVDSIVLSEFFNKFVGHSFDKKFIHEKLKTIPSFLFGVFDSDGSINKRSVGSIAMNNINFIKDLKDMMDFFGIPTYIGKKVNSIRNYGDYPMLVIPKNSLSLIINNLSKKYKDSRIEKCIASNNGTVRIINGEAYIQLSSIEEETGKQKVYNLSVENNHDYVVENVHVHNCYVATDPQDSMEDIYRAAYDIARTYSFGGGQGMNLSNLRPKGAKVNNSSNTTPGVMTFAELYSFITLNTQQENRRGALMLMLNIDHPDVIDFITAKLDLSKINGANISLAITDGFMKAYKNNEEWAMKFETAHETIEKRVNARDLMELISYSAHTMGDPGVIFIDTMNNYHLLSEYEDVHFTATNPCGEQPLEANGSCNLGSINLNAFVRKPFTDEAYFDLERFKEVTKEMIWGLDELLIILGERHALEQQRQHVIDFKEVGLGIMGLADLALTMKLGYGTKEFINVLETIMKEMANSAAQASAIRAKELGVFPKYDYDKISASSFFKEVYTNETKELIKKYGLRNSRLLSIAPTGSISNILGVSGGVEPFFLLGYQRTIKSMFEDERTIWVYEKTPLKMMKHFGYENHKQLPEWAQVTSQNIKFEDRALVQSTIQKYVDTAISSTFNLPNSASTNDIKNIYSTGWSMGFKGATVFRDNCKKIGILTGGGDNFDKNPAPKPSFEISEKWHNKTTGETKEYITFISIDETNYKSEKIEKEMCPLCGAHLVKQQGCTKCSNPDCVFEKCAL